MEDFRSKSYGHGRMQIEPYNGTGMQDLRCYSASYASSVHPTQTQTANNNINDVKFKKGNPQMGPHRKVGASVTPSCSVKRGSLATRCMLLKEN
ncbi:hypothetical protein ACSQ67_006516 [Phaseolus vulgaris]